MSGTKEGGKRAATTNKAKHGEDFYKSIGHKGGSKSHPETRPFTTNPELAKRAGRAGGLKSKRGKAKPKDHQEAKSHQEEIKKHFDLYGWFTKKAQKNHEKN